MKKVRLCCMRCNECENGILHASFSTDGTKKIISFNLWVVGTVVGTVGSQHDISMEFVQRWQLLECHKDMF